MKGAAVILGLGAAVVVHGLVLTFGGILFLHDDADKGSLQQVDLLTSEDVDKPKEKDKAVTLSVNAKGEVFWNKEKITQAQLPMRLQTLKSTSKDPKVIINGDAKASFDTVVAVLNAVRAIGIGKVGINTDKK